MKFTILERWQRSLKELLSGQEWIKEVFEWLITVGITILVVVVVLHILHRIFRKILHSGDKLYIRFVEQTLRTAIILLAVFSVFMSSDFTEPFGRVLFQGTAIIGAIAGLAAQPVISDLICGFMLSASKPFDLGDRVELEDGTAGIIKDITIRHVVIRTIDTMDVIIPNSKLNSMRILNTSHHTKIRSVHFRFSVAYDCDVEQAMQVIGKAVEESPYSVKGFPSEDGEKYGPVYFIAYEESSLTMATTVYYEPTSPTEVVKSDINCRVKKALSENGIEIPYPYLNVLMQKDISS